jgi:NADH-quinone oxidoreductase subunit A
VLINYLPILILLVISTVLAAVVIFISTFLGPHRPTLRKLQPYESGMTPLGPAQRRMPVKFYLVAVMFILFDVEIIFLYPWAVTFRQLGLFGFIEMVIFVAILLVGYVYAWKKGALEWE